MSTDRKGHCHHCCDGCPGGTPIPAWPFPEMHSNDNWAEWSSKACPACAEAERITAWLLAEAERLSESNNHDSRVSSATHAHAAVKILKGEI